MSCFVDRNSFFFRIPRSTIPLRKGKRKKVGWEYIFKVDILKWRGGTFGVYFRGYILSKQRGLDRGLE